jgi:hypothetical protein
MISADTKLNINRDSPIKPFKFKIPTRQVKLHLEKSVED